MASQLPKRLPQGLLSNLPPKRFKSVSINDVITHADAIISRAAQIAERAKGLEDGSDELHQLLLELNKPPIMTALSLPTMSASPGPKPGQVLTNNFVFATVFSRFKSLYDQQPQHPIFGKPETGKICAPLRVKGRNQCSWEAKCHYLANAIEASNGRYITPGDCWMKVDFTMTFQMKVGGKPVVLVSFMIVRLLAFITSPTEEAWQAFVGHLENGSRSIDSPFTHWCHNGHGSKGGRISRTLGCVNGVQHGAFGTVQENVDQKKCRNRDRSLCPGHGPSKLGFCIFVHGNGAQKACLNYPEGKPQQCPCEIKCF
jgi:hypothetical protein